jgi:hypothetical protein
MRSFIGASQPLTDWGVKTGVRKSDPPVGDIAGQQFDGLAGIGQDEIIGMSLVVIQEIILDRVGAVSEAKNEFIVSKMRVVTHDVPQHRSVANLHHGLRKWRVDTGTHPHAETATKQDNLHDAP